MSQNAQSAILSTFIKLPVVIKTFFLVTKLLSIFEWPFYTGFTVVILVLILSAELSCVQDI